MAHCSALIIAGFLGKKFAVLPGGAYFAKDFAFQLDWGFAMASVPQTLVRPVRRRRLLRRRSGAPRALPKPARLSCVEAGRGTAACLIVAHHLSAYGTASDLAAEAAPELMEFLYEYARMAVQTFLVFGGFSLAWMLGDRRLTWTQASQALAWRYLRLVIPYAATIALLLLAACLTTTPTGEPPLIDSFSWAQTAAHAFFLQDVLGYGNFSAGTWYLCIDLQFACLFLAVAAMAQSLCRRFLQTDATPRHLCLLLAPLGVCSAWLWNRMPAGDRFVFYFLAPMVLGALVAWVLRGKIPVLVLVVYSGLIAASLALDFRPRLLVALATAGALLLLAPSATAESVFRYLAPLGRISYSLFLIHYLVNWLVLAALTPLIDERPERAVAALTIAFAASLGAALLLYFGVERPALQWLISLKPAPRARYEASQAQG